MANPTDRLETLLAEEGELLTERPRLWSEYVSMCAEAAAGGDPRQGRDHEIARQADHRALLEKLSTASKRLSAIDRRLSEIRREKHFAGRAAKTL